MMKIKRLINFLFSYITVIFFLCVSTSFCLSSDQTSHYDILAQELFRSLDKNAVVAMQPLSEDETKIPSPVLRSIEVGIISALQKQSGFEIKLISRDRLQLIWKEAREFGTKKFADLVSDAGADILLVSELRPTTEGIELSVRAFRVRGSSVGTIVASSTPRVLPFDWKKELGVQPIQISEAMKEMSDALKRLGASGGLVANPKTPAEFYHNARILAQRGEVDLAISAYENVLQSKILYIDPLLDLLALANRLYGAEGTKVYVRKKLDGIVPPEISFTAKMITSDEYDPDVVDVILKKRVAFPPLYVEWAKKQQPWSDTVFIRRMHFDTLKFIVDQYRSGALQSFYLDQIRGAAAGEEAAEALKFYQSEQIKKMLKSPAFVYFHGREPKPSLQSFNDSVDIEKPISVCTSKDLRSEKLCRDIRSLLKIEQREQMLLLYGGGNMNWAVGHACVHSIEYTDIKGNLMSVRPFISFEKRNDYKAAPAIIAKIQECAGEMVDTTRN